MKLVSGGREVAWTFQKFKLVERKNLAAALAGLSGASEDKELAAFYGRLVR